MTIHQQVAAGIDLGSNTFRLLVAECTGESMRMLVKKMATVRLGRGLQKSRMLHEESMQKGFEVLLAFRDILDQYKPESLRVCGTEALRQARNSHLFLHKAAGILGAKIEIVNGAEEARLSLAGGTAGFHIPLLPPLLLIDVGGGSTELLFTEDILGRRIEAVSTDLGVVSLTEKFLASLPPAIDQLDGMLSETIRCVLGKLNRIKEHAAVNIIGCGGTATSMAALDLNLAAYNESLVQGHVLQNTSIEKLWNRLITLPPDKRNTLPCLGEGRGEILPAGVRIYHLLLKLLQQDRMMVSDSGLLEGILLSSLPHSVA
jgi:exopolyphosphatase/guanosine-5'-triphosphate,3'-diphosphate pyrophosphatase